jgi:hypothetical protein
MHLEKNQVFLYDSICQLEHFLLFIKFILKLLVLKINLNHQDQVLRNFIDKNIYFANHHYLVILIS